MSDSNSEPDSDAGASAVHADPSSVGMNPRKLCRVVERFRNACERGSFPGGQLVVRRRGRSVVDEAVGLARGVRVDERAPPEAVTPATRFPAFSAGKPVIAVCFAMLQTRGMLDVRAPIATVLPEFGANGKEAITTLDVLTHRAGIVMAELAAHPEDWGDQERVRAALVTVRPTYPRGTLAYRPLEFGWILTHVFERVTGRALREFIATEIASPLGLSALCFGVSRREVPSLARTYWVGRTPKAAPGFDMSDSFEERYNAPGALTAFVPAAALVTNAGTLARFYDMLIAGGVAPNGQRLVSDTLVRHYTSYARWGRGHHPPSERGAPFAVGRGFLLEMLPNGAPSEQPCFGQAGAFCTLAFADPRNGLSFAAVTNGNRGPMEFSSLFMPLAALVRSATDA